MVQLSTVMRYVEGGLPKSRATPIIQPSVVQRSTKTCVHVLCLHGFNRNKAGLRGALCCDRFMEIVHHGLLNITTKIIISLNQTNFTSCSWI